MVSNYVLYMVVVYVLFIVINYSYFKLRCFNFFIFNLVQLELKSYFNLS
jgi:hypothetical protein